jgi:hypothetical protein
VAIICTVLLAACASGAQQQRHTVGPGSAHKPSVTFVRLAKCCMEPARRRLVQNLEHSLGRRAAVTSTTASAEQAAPATSPSSLPQLLDQARKLYFGMRMNSAEELLLKGWNRQLQQRAQGARARDLARLHAYLVAIYDALGRKKRVRQHSDAAMRFFPQLSLDDDMFTPSVKQALERARQARSNLAVTIRSNPAGAEVFWNGTTAGASPVTLRAQPKGMHLLRLTHPLCLPWAERVQLTTSVELKPVLKAAPVAQVGTYLATHPELGQVATQLLDTDGLLLLEAHPRGIALRLFDRTGQQSKALLAHETPVQPLANALQAKLERSKKRRAAMALAEAPAPRPTSQPSKAKTWSDHLKRHWWAYALGATVAVAASIALPLALSRDAGGRDLIVELR